MIIHLLRLFLIVLSTHCYSIDHESVSAYTMNSRTGEVLLDQDGDRSLIPASCMKLITIGAALHVLGPDMRFQTHLEYDGTLDEQGVLHGNLYIRGEGDPCLGSNRIPSSLSWQEQVDVWVMAIVKLGIVRIDGEVIGDATRWEKQMAVSSWLWEDLANYYGVGASALSFHENSYTLFFKPGDQEGDHTTIVRLDPPLTMLTLINEVKTGSKDSGDRANIYGMEYYLVQHMRGTVPLGGEFSIKGAIPDPPTTCAYFLTQALENKKIAIGHSSYPQSKERKVIHTTYSPTVKEIVHWTNQKSINLYAEHLLKKMGEVVHGEGSTAAGIKAVTSFWKAQGIDLSGFNMEDGSGLSRKNFVTAKQLVAILKKMKESSHFVIFFDSLPEIEGRREKRGTQSKIRCFAGYHGDTIFATLVNFSSK